MPDQTYQIKIRGRVLGPFPAARLIQMVQRGQLSRVHQISTDGSNWERASQFPQFFAVAETPVAKVVTNRGKSSAQKDGFEDENTCEIPVASSEDVKWHYAINGQSTGPVSQKSVAQLVKNGELGSNNKVWHSGLEAWTPVSQVAELAKFLQSPKARENNNRHLETSRIDHRVSRDGSGNLDSLKPVLSSSTPWAYFICGFLFLVSLALFFQFVSGLVIGGKEGNSGLIFMGVMALFQMFVTVAAGIFLQRYASATNRFVLTDEPSSLFESLKWLQRFWMLIGIVLIVWIVFVLVLVILVYSVGLQF